MNVLLDSQCVTDRTALMHHTLLVVFDSGISWSSNLSNSWSDSSLAALDDDCSSISVTACTLHKILNFLVPSLYYRSGDCLREHAVDACLSPSLMYWLQKRRLLEQFWASGTPFVLFLRALLVNLAHSSRSGSAPYIHDCSVTRADPSDEAWATTLSAMVCS